MSVERFPEKDLTQEKTEMQKIDVAKPLPPPFTGLIPFIHDVIGPKDTELLLVLSDAFDQRYAAHAYVRLQRFSDLACTKSVDHFGEIGYVAGLIAHAPPAVREQIPDYMAEIGIKTLDQLTEQPPTVRRAVEEILARDVRDIKASDFLALDWLNAAYRCVLASLKKLPESLAEDKLLSSLQLNLVSQRNSYFRNDTYSSLNRLAKTSVDYHLGPHGTEIVYAIPAQKPQWAYPSLFIERGSARLKTGLDFLTNIGIVGIPLIRIVSDSNFAKVFKPIGGYNFCFKGSKLAEKYGVHGLRMFVPQLLRAIEQNTS
ncbi:MAG: hypothetical protein M1120_02115 [Patescibacteria group bacterium]|nr:hypothetical protein [Patescibacteria group bacterium]